MKRAKARTQEDVDSELVDILSGREAPEDRVTEALFDRRMGEMKRSGLMPEEQRVIIRVWRHGPVWVAPMSIGPALVPFTEITTKDLGRTEIREILGGVPEQILPAPGGGLLMKRGPLTGMIASVPEDTEPEELAQMISELREQWDAHINTA